MTLKCPVCNSSEIDYTIRAEAEGELHWYCECKDCHHRWDEFRDKIIDSSPAKYPPYDTMRREQKAEIRYELMKMSAKFDNYIFMEALSEEVAEWISRRVSNHLKQTVKK